MTRIPIKPLRLFARGRSVGAARSLCRLWCLGSGDAGNYRPVRRGKRDRASDGEVPLFLYRAAGLIAASRDPWRAAQQLRAVAALASTLPFNQRCSHTSVGFACPPGTGASLSRAGARISSGGATTSHYSNAPGATTAQVWGIDRASRVSWPAPTPSINYSTQRNEGVALPVWNEPL
jgi:hypothetical protein